MQHPLLIFQKHYHKLSVWPIRVEVHKCVLTSTILRASLIINSNPLNTLWGAPQVSMSESLSSESLRETTTDLCLGSWGEKREKTVGHFNNTAPWCQCNSSTAFQETWYLTTSGSRALCPPLGNLLTRGWDTVFRLTVLKFPLDGGRTPKLGEAGPQGEAGPLEVCS